MRTPAQYLRGIRHPEAFHGRRISKGFFEGWYIKLVSADQRQRWAVIPGVFRGNGKDEAFVQILDGGSEHHGVGLASCQACGHATN